MARQKPTQPTSEPTSDSFEHTASDADNQAAEDAQQPATDENGDDTAPIEGHEQTDDVTGDEAAKAEAAKAEAAKAEAAKAEAAKAEAAKAEAAKAEAAKAEAAKFLPDVLDLGDGRVLYATQVGLPNTCSATGTPCIDRWFAANTDAARSGHGICEEAARELLELVSHART